MSRRSEERSILSEKSAARSSLRVHLLRRSLLYLNHQHIGTEPDNLGKSSTEVGRSQLGPIPANRYASTTRHSQGTAWNAYSYFVVLYTSQIDTILGWVVGGDRRGSTRRLHGFQPSKSHTRYYACWCQAQARSAKMDDGQGGVGLVRGGSAEEPSRKLYIYWGKVSQTCSACHRTPSEEATPSLLLEKLTENVHEDRTFVWVWTLILRPFGTVRRSALRFWCQPNQDTPPPPSRSGQPGHVHWEAEGLSLGLDESSWRVSWFNGLWFWY